MRSNLTRFGIYIVIPSDIESVLKSPTLEK
jgi:hypothetical protein